MPTQIFFPYSWNIDEDQDERTVMRIYGLGTNNQTIGIIINNFTPYIYLELPTEELSGRKIIWTETKAQLVGNKLDILLKDKKPLKKRLTFKEKLYGAHLTPDDKKMKFPYLFMSFSTKADIKNLSYKIRSSIHIMSMGPMKFRMHEQDASEILQFTSILNISTANWISFVGKRILGEDKVTICDEEYKVKWKNVENKILEKTPKPLICSFDIEVNSTNTSAMPKSTNPGDEIFQISCVLLRHGEIKTDDHILTLGDPDPKIIGKNTTIHRFDTEHELLLGYSEFLRKHKVNIIVGYNIFNFDIPYMIERAKIKLILYEFDRQGFLKYGHAKEKEIKWSSSAYGKQIFKYLDAEGVLFVDLLPLVKRDYKMNNYQLKTIAEHFLGQTKDPLDAKGIFKCYRVGIKNNNGVYSSKARYAMGLVGKYCVQDSMLVMKLFTKLQTWVGLCEMANVCNVPIFYLYTQGQQIKVYSQIYKFCLDKNIVVEKDGYIPKEGEHYQGAKVFDPIPGMYYKVVPLDFKSLYPSTMIAYNIDYSTLVDENDKSIPNRKCNVMVWEDHVGCIVKGTKITIGEYSINIEDLQNYKKQLLAYNGKNGLTYYDQTNFFNQGIKECLELTFNDGTTLKCTQDHKILCNDNKWIEAKNIKLNIDNICTGYSPPVYNIKDNVLCIDDFTFRENTLIIFYKILGLMITDGYCAKGRTMIYLGHKIDIQNITRDIEYITQDKKSYAVRKQNYGWGVSIKGKFGELLRNLEGVLWNKKSTQTRTLPKILENASNGELCAFLSGLMGGDGHTFSFSEKAQTIGSLSLSWSSEKEEMLSSVFNKLQFYMKKCGVNTTISRIKTSTYLNININDILTFKEKIGFSYCVHKSMRLEAGYSYYKYRLNVWEQQKYIVEKVRKLKSVMTLKKAIEKVVEDIKQTQPIYNEYYTNYSVSQMTDLLRDRKKWDKPMFSRKHFYGPMEYMDSINSTQLFNSYSVNEQKDSIPMIKKKIIYVKSIGKKQVYDLEVNISHSFIADGILVHNCSHDPKIIRKLQLDKVISKEKDIIKKIREKKNKTLNKLRKQEYMDEINKLTLELKPYIKERSSINKKKNKHTMCAKRKFRWIKESIYKGVMPTVLQNLLDARAKTRKEAKVLEKILKLDEGNLEEENKITTEDKKLIDRKFLKMMEKDKLSPEDIDTIKSLIEVLDKRQLAYKISANSMYGAMGVTRGYLPFMPGAMATTYMGRKNIEISADKVVNVHRGTLVYGDTDSVMVYFEHLNTAQEIWDYAIKVAKEITDLFPGSLILEFEKIIYWKFFILTKKRYMMITCLRNGILSIKIKNKGVLLARRDNSKFVRDLYETVVMMIFDTKDRDDTIYYILTQLDKLCSNNFPYDDFIATKAIGDHGELKVEKYFDEKKQKEKGRCGGYIVPLLSNEEKERTRQFKLKNCNTVRNYYLRCLPAQVQLAERMRNRGQRVDVGTRLEYVISSQAKHTAKQYERIESADYFKNHSSVIKLDFMYYLSNLANPMDEILNIGFDRDVENAKYTYKFEPDLIHTQYKYRLKIRTKMLNELKDLFNPKIIFE